MRKMLLAFLALFFVVSCGKSDGNGNETTNPLIGTWDIQTKTINKAIQNLSECDKKETLVFTEKTINRIESEMQNGVCTSLGDDIATYTISGDKLIENHKDETEEYTFSIKDSMLTMILTEKNGDLYITTYKKR